MSLLLDALKKAEKAKDDARRRSHEAEAPGPDDTVVQVRTRNDLPEISKNLEFHSEDLSSGITSERPGSAVPDAFSTAPARPAAEPAPVNAGMSPDNSARRQPPARDAEKEYDTQSAQRSAAKHVFEAKFREPNPKLPFYITMALLGAFAIGTVVYFWYQLRPPPSLVNLNAKPPADEKRVEAPLPQAGTTPLQGSGGAISPGPLVPGLPPVQAQGSATLPSIPAASPAAPVAPAGVAPAKAPAADAGALRGRAPAASAPSSRSAPRGAPAAASNLSVNRPSPGINPKVEAGWTAYNRGDLNSARASYTEMLKEEPANRDALLGMAAVEIRSNRLEQAEIHYRTLLSVDPRDPYAQTGLLALRGQMSDPVQSESRVKNLLAADPDAQILNFTLGNQYAQQGRWPEAQQAYFKAYSAEPENPDFAYNLAVSLDQVRQPKLALEYYRRALSLAQQRSSSFDQGLARNRAQELSR
jgi:tetratricopeptide (TPR) repeat protein